MYSAMGNLGDKHVIKIHQDLESSLSSETSEIICV